MRLIFSNLMKKCEKSTDEEIIEHGRVGCYWCHTKSHNSNEKAKSVTNQNVWSSVHKLNQNSKYFEQNLDQKEIEQIAKMCGKEWTNKWIRRTKNKNKSQKIKDRELLEHVGYFYSREIDGKRSNPNETEIERLLANGATVDVFVPDGNDGYGCLCNAIDFANRARTEEISKLLINKFPSYKKEKNEDWKTHLGDLFYQNKVSAGIELVKSKVPVHPLYDILSCLRDDSKFKTSIEEIFKIYNPSTQVKLAFQLLAEENKFQHNDVKNNLQLLKKYFLKNTNYGPKFIQSALGSTYKIDDPICSRFERNGKKIWVAQEIRNLELEGLVEFKSDGLGKIMVNLHYTI